jgi:hypothetical protein
VVASRLPKASIRGFGRDPRRASLKRLRPEGKPEGCGPYPTDRVLGGDRRDRSRTGDCFAPWVDAHLQSRRRRRDDRGAGRAGALLHTPVARRCAGGDIGVVSSSYGRRQSPFDPGRIGVAYGNCAAMFVVVSCPPGCETARLCFATRCLHSDVWHRWVSANSCRTSASANGIATRDVTPRVATPTETLSVAFFCSGGRRYGPNTGGRLSSNARHKGMRGRQRWDPQRFRPRVRIPRRPRKAMAGAPNPCGARLGEHVLWSPCQRDGRRWHGW